MTTPSTPAPEPPALLIGDADRVHVQDELGRAVGLGELTLSEFDDRVQAVFRARTVTDLRALLTDLPSAGIGVRGVPTAWTSPTTPSFPSSVQVAARPTGPTGVRRKDTRPSPRARAHPADPWVRWAALAVLMIAIWVAIGIPTGAWYPWPIWPILGTAVGAVRQTVEQARVGRARIGT